MRWLREKPTSANELLGRRTPRSGPIKSESEGIVLMGYRTLPNNSGSVAGDEESDISIQPTRVTSSFQAAEAEARAPARLALRSQRPLCRAGDHHDGGGNKGPYRHRHCSWIVKE